MQSAFSKISFEIIFYVIATVLLLDIGKTDVCDEIFYKEQSNEYVIDLIKLM